jgi:hypothetical protein
MWTPAGASSPVARAAAGAQLAYLDLVTATVGPDDAWRYGGLLLTSVHGLVGFEQSGFLAGGKWPAAEELVDLLLDRLPHVLGPPGGADRP